MKPDVVERRASMFWSPERIYQAVGTAEVASEDSWVV